MFLFSSLHDHFFDMLSYITDKPFDELDDERRKLANVVCEILSYDSISFDDIFESNDRYFKQLWSVLCVRTTKSDVSDEPNEPVLSAQPPAQTDQNLPSHNTGRQLNSLIASYFNRVFSALFQRYTDTMLTYLWQMTEPNDYVSCILRHLNTSAIMDLIAMSWEFLMNPNNDRNQELASKFHQVNGL